ncbi:hypothetical protein OLD77_12645 [Serratia rubidaea]|nr:hypothetical protein [Serratia rubidaea]WBF43513.1 hypothetical protein OLD77_12645 [Serratia rubidaea]
MSWAKPALRGATLQLNVNNVADKHYVASCGNTSACFYGSGRRRFSSPRLAYPDGTAAHRQPQTRRNALR